jgi:ribulose-5-phosphate 4-epimerase/fuculose-1-phosphate aldolase
VKYQDLREEVAQVARQLIESGLVTGTSGNVSTSTPEGDILITPSALDYAQLGAEDVLLYGTEELAGYVSEALRETCNACLLQNHGTITVGEGPKQAFSRTVVLEEMAQIYYRARVAGQPILLTEEQVEEVAGKITGYGQTKPASTDSRA